MQSLKFLPVIAIIGVMTQAAQAQYKIGDRLVVINQAEIRSGAVVRQVLGRGQDVRVDAVNLDQLLVKNLAAGWINAGLVRPPELAVAVFSEQILRNPFDAGAYYARGITRADLNLYDLAIGDFTRAIQLGPTHACGFNGRGNCWANTGETAKAISDYTDAIRLDPNMAIAWANRARMWNKTGDFAKAIADANEAIRIAPTYANAYSARAIALAATKRFDEAIADCDRIAAISVPGVSGHDDVAWFLATSSDDNIRDGKKAIEFATKAFDLTNGRDGGVLDTLAVAWAEMADFDQAVSWETKALAISADRDRAVFESHLKLFQSHQTLLMSPSGEVVRAPSRQRPGEAIGQKGKLDRQRDVKRIDVVSKER
jgi:tetratricopeptide (TPR) repeat protein